VVKEQGVTKSFKLHDATFDNISTKFQLI